MKLNSTAHRVREKQEWGPQNKAGSHHGTAAMWVGDRHPSLACDEEHRRQTCDSPKTMVFNSRFATS